MASASRTKIVAISFKLLLKDAKKWSKNGLSRLDFRLNIKAYNIFIIFVVAVITYKRKADAGTSCENVSRC